MPSPRIFGKLRPQFSIPDSPLIDRLCGCDHLPAPVLIHPVKVMDWSRALAERMSVGNCRGDVGLGQQHRVRQAATVRKVACHGSGKGTAGPVG